MNTDICLIQQVWFEVTDVSHFLKELRDIATRNDVSIICLDRNAMAGQKHVTSAINHAFRSYQEGINVARSLEIEVLLYAAGTRQTSLTKPFGIHPGKNEAYLCICPPNKNASLELSSLVNEKNTEDWEAISEEKMRVLQDLFAITKEELEVVGYARIQDLVCERVALLDVQK